MSTPSKRSNTFLWMFLLLILVCIVASARNTGKVDFYLPNFHLRMLWPYLIACLTFLGFTLGWLSRLGGLRKKSQIIKEKNREIDGLEKKMEGVMASMAAIGAQARSTTSTEVITDSETRYIEDTNVGDELTDTIEDN